MVIVESRHHIQRLREAFPKESSISNYHGCQPWLIMSEDRNEDLMPTQCEVAETGHRSGPIIARTERDREESKNAEVRLFSHADPSSTQPAEDSVQ